MSVGVGLGLLFLAREGISFAMLKQIPRPAEETDEPAPEPGRRGRTGRGRKRRDRACASASACASERSIGG